MEDYGSCEIAMIYIYKAELIKVVDGDTVDLAIDLGFDTIRKERFRLYGIDAAEMKTSDGPKAKQWLESHIESSLLVETFQLATKAKRDKYGRFLAVLWNASQVTLNPLKISGVSLNAQMVNAGLAVERYW